MGNLTEKNETSQWSIASTLLDAGQSHSRTLDSVRRCARYDDSNGSNILFFSSLLYAAQLIPTNARSRPFQNQTEESRYNTYRTLTHKDNA